MPEAEFAVVFFLLLDVPNSPQIDGRSLTNYCKDQKLF